MAATILMILRLSNILLTRALKRKVKMIKVAKTILDNDGNIVARAAIECDTMAEYFEYEEFHAQKRLEGEQVRAHKGAAMTNAAETRVDVSDSNQGRLWAMLDDIDTLSDSIKPSSIEGYEKFYSAALQFANKRHLILKSDGHGLFEFSISEAEKEQWKGELNATASDIASQSKVDTQNFDRMKTALNGINGELAMVTHLQVSEDSKVAVRLIGIRNLLDSVGDLCDCKDGK